ncbi:DUF998 domain-containing protein [Cohnella nanjingensis]|uniref:DUF998 domain-containing protein n=1 Tax=Cohnella nanjingensis TaxID=1387779 RepID=A0A7X0VE84_9BACL|nr:DUF998 domain-containing protein [Cohnella nanjingensis]MBB6670732.1 DUF998 domain-containing protein [Cohnella nanjingensis]
MVKHHSTNNSKGVSSFSRRAARVSFIVTLAFVVILFALHALEPEFAPSWRMISEYELGDYGWVMQLAFFCLGLGCLSLIAAIEPSIRSIGGYVGLFFMLVAAVGLFIAGLFQTDPITISREHWSTHGAWHAWGSVMVIPVAPITSSLISLSFSRRRQFSLQARRLLWAATAVIWLSLIAFIAGGGTKFEGTRGPGDWTGWANRVFIVGFSIWMMIVAWNRIKTVKVKSTTSHHRA